MTAIFITLLIITIAVIFLLLRKRQLSESPVSVQSRTAKSRPLAQSAKPNSTSTDYRAASLQVEKTSCAAALDLAGKRFLAAEIPAIPLQECDRIGACACKFRKYSDRRSDDDRRSNSYAVDRITASEKEQSYQRAKTDRRKLGEGDMHIFDFK